MPADSPNKVLLIELNEITWRLLDPLLQSGELPTFSELISRGAKGTPVAVENPPDLDPWISWTTVYTGRPPEEHGVKFLEQPPNTVHGPRIWEIAARAGKSLGVFGSIMSWPPQKGIKGFWVPGTFSPGPETEPPELQPIQDMNLKYTRAHTPLSNGVKVSKFALLRSLRKLGLRMSTLAEVANYFFRRAIGSAREWEKVSLQPLINLDLFAAQWKKFRPDFATFHSNHVAHYQHRYWRSTDPELFPEKPSAEEVNEFGGAIRHGYKVADRLLRKVLDFVGPDTTLVIASGLGQQPYVVEEFRGGRTVVRMNDVNQVLDLAGVAGCGRAYSVMAPQYNVEFDNPNDQSRAVKSLRSAYYKSPEHPLFSVTEVGNAICINIMQKLVRPIEWDAECVFPDSGRTVKMRELASEKDPTPKQGYHDKPGVLIMAGPGIRSGVDIGECSTLDLAPTMLAILGLPAPDYMKGRVLSEALEPGLPSRDSGSRHPQLVASGK